MVTSLAKTLIGKTFPACGNIGNNIENLFGVMPNNSYNADLGKYEIKSRNIDAKSFITLGGKKTENTSELLSQVYNKIKNTIFVEYKVSGYNFTISKITMLENLSHSDFIALFPQKVKLENRSDGQKTLKMYVPNFISMYPIKNEL